MMTIALILFTAFADGEQASQLNEDTEKALNDSLLTTIGNQNEKEETLVAAIRKLRKVTELSGFWTKIANSKAYNATHRRHAVYQLFQRHVPPGVTLCELGKRADKPTWLNPEDIRVIEYLGGKIPVKWTAGDTIFTIGVFPDLRDNWTIYMRVSGKVTLNDFKKLILNGESENIKRRKVLEIGFSPTLEEVYGGKGGKGGRREEKSAERGGSGSAGGPGGGRGKDDGEETRPALPDAR
jgi:hypothetical protein